MTFSKYINIPYKHKGDTFKSCDCLGLVKLILREESNIFLPEFWYVECWKDGDNYFTDNIGSVSTKKVKPPYKKLDGLLFYDEKRKYVKHIGLYIGNSRFIHTYRKNSSRVDKLGGYWSSRLYEAVRYTGKRG